MSRVLITGGAGFIGSHTAEELLRQGHQVRIIDCLDPQIHGMASSWPSYLHQDIERVRGDIREPGALASALAGIDAVYHFAAHTGVGQSMYEAQRYVDTNLGGTAAVLDAIVAHQKKAREQGHAPIRRLILASSRAVYGEGTFQCARCGTIYPPTRPRQHMESGDFDIHCPACAQPCSAIPTAEERPCRPISVYGLTKLHQEDYCRHVAQVHGLSVVNLRYFNVYGSRQALNNPYTGVVSVFYSRLRGNEPISLYEHGLPLRDFVHVHDVARANVLALSAQLPTDVCLNIGSGEGCTIAQLAAVMRDLTQSRSQFLDTGKFRVGDVWACYADITRARQLLNYAPSINLRDGLREVLQWAQGQTITDRSAQAESELFSHGLLGRAATA